jgi:hypothetical protein
MLGERHPQSPTRAAPSCDPNQPNPTPAESQVNSTRLRALDLVSCIRFGPWRCEVSKRVVQCGMRRALIADSGASQCMRGPGRLQVGGGAARECGAQAT